MQINKKTGALLGMGFAMGTLASFVVWAQQQVNTTSSAPRKMDPNAVDASAEAARAKDDNAALKAGGGYVTPSFVDWPEPWKTMLGNEGYYPSQRWPSKTAAEQYTAATQIDPNVPSASPKWKAVSFLSVNGKGGEDVTGPYAPVIPWPKPLYGNTTADWGFGGQGSIYVESPDRVFVVQRDEVPPITRPLSKEGYVWGPDAVMEYVKAPKMAGRRKGRHVMIFDRSGNLVDWWQQWNKLWDGDNEPSQINVNPYDPERKIWIVGDERMHVFSNDGKKLIMTVENTDPSGQVIGMHGGIAWLPNSDFFLLGVNRVARFSKDGKYLSSFGKHGSGPGEFGGLLQGIAIHPKTHRIYIGDRLNSRISVFDENGKFLDEWPNIIGTYVVRLSKDDHIWIEDTATSKFVKYDLNGKFITSFGTFGIAAGATWSSHYFDTDSEGAVYTVSDYPAREGAIQKWVPRKDMPRNDPRLIGPLYR